MDSASIDEHHPSSKEWQEWKRLLSAALIELDEGKLLERIALARSAVVKRMEQVGGKQEHQQERTELWDALNSLQALQNISRHRSK